MTADVLVVDDDRNILEVLAMRLESLGLRVTATGAPAEVVDLMDALQKSLAARRAPKPGGRAKSRSRPSSKPRSTRKSA